MVARPFFAPVRGASRCGEPVGTRANHLGALRDAAAAESAAGGDTRVPVARSVIYLFLSGGLGQHDSFDLKPAAPTDIRGEFRPIATNTPARRFANICRSWRRAAICGRCVDHSPIRRTITRWDITSCSRGSRMPRGIQSQRTSSQRLARVGGGGHGCDSSPQQPATGGRAAGETGPPHGASHPGTIRGNHGSPKRAIFRRVLGVSGGRVRSLSGVRIPPCDRPVESEGYEFQAPNLTVPKEMIEGRFGRRLDLLGAVDQQRRDLDRYASVANFDRYRQGVVSLLTDPKTRTMFDVRGASEADQTRYGKNLFGWSLLMARRLVAGGVNLVQVNLGNNETWDTHGTRSRA